ncbi:hypothetical protein FHS63_004035 [Azospirillum doebereinerae]
MGVLRVPMLGVELALSTIDEDTDVSFDLDVLKSDEDDR